MNPWFNVRVKAGSVFALLLIGLFIGADSIFAQEAIIYDTPIYAPGYGPTPGANVPAVITTADGYDNFDIGTDFAEPHMDENPRNPTQYFNAFNTNAAHRTNNAFDWVSSTPAFGATMRGDPIVAYDSLGNLYYENMFGSPNILGCKVIRSTDNGATWTASVTAIDGVDKNWIVCDQTMGPYANYVYTVMTHNDGVSNYGNFARSTDQGATWTSTFTTSTQVLPGMMVAVGPNVLGGNNISGGCVYVVTNSGSSFAATYTFFASTDGGSTFALKSAQSFSNYVGTMLAGRNTVDTMRTRPYPFIAADNSYGTYRGRLYVVYASNAPSGDGNKPEVFSRYSTDQGTTWSSAVKINDDPSSTANHQWHPSIWCDKETGRLYAKWMDTRNDATSDSAEIYASYSDNGGVTWAVNQKISNAKMKINCTTCGGGGAPARYQGDYDAIVSNSNTSMLVWTDFRNGTFRSMTGFFPDFAMLMTKSNVIMNSTEVDTNRIAVPSVKLYTGTAKFSATFTPAAPITIEFPEGDSLTSYPDSVIMKITTTGVSPGVYTVTVVGQGPNGTPIHKRTFTITVPTPTVTLTSPNGAEVWPSGTLKTISWTSVNPSEMVKIELARNGVTYNEVLFDSTTNDGSESWLVTGPGTTSARMRVSNVGGSATDVSNAFFTIASVAVSSPNGGEDWFAGSSQNLTWNSTGVSGNVHLLLSRDGGVSFPETLFANTANDGIQSWTVTGPATSQARVLVVNVPNPGIADTTDADFTVSASSATMAVGWNLVSLPVTAGDPRPSSVFPSGDSPAYGFAPSGYFVEDTLEHGKGYWMLFNSADVVSFSGSPVEADTIDVPYGWSLFGSISYSVPMDSIEQVPPGLVDAFYSYSPGSGYQANPPSIEPGVSLWLNANQAGQIIVRKPSGPVPPSVLPTSATRRLDLGRK